MKICVLWFTVISRPSKETTFAWGLYCSLDQLHALRDGTHLLFQESVELVETPTTHHTEQDL